MITIWVLRVCMNRMFAEEKRRSRSPFKEKLLRPVGESLRLRIEEIQSDLFEQGLILAIVVAGTGGVLFWLHANEWLTSVVIGSVVAAAGALLVRFRWNKVKKLREDLRNHRLGFDGERYVAEKLGELLLQQYRIYHDFLFDMKPGGEATNFNIDHIAIGPAGVFAVETKTFRQPSAELAKGDKSHEVIVRGEWMILPGDRKTKKPMEQARRNAQDLSKWLTGSASEPVRVIPVVAMPGWFVRDDASGEVRVLNALALPKMIPKLGSGKALTEDEIQRLSDRVEAHCRNVEGA